MGHRIDIDAKNGGGALLDAVLLLSSDLDLRGALDRLIRASCALTGARYGFMGLLDDNGVIADFVIHGLTDDQIARIPSLPTGKGILGVLIEDPQPLRLAKIADHERSVGFPANHPPMNSFLGVPVRVDGRVYGNLYLTEKAGGQQFTKDDETLLEVLAQIAGLVIGNARTHAGTQSRYRWLESSIAMSDALEESVGLDAALEEVTRRLLVVADALAVGAVRYDGVDLDLVAAVRKDGEAPDPSVLVENWGTAIATASRDGRAVLAERGDGITRLVVPMSSRLLQGHFLIVGLDQGALGVEGPDLDLFTAFADQASLALDRTQALAERQEHMLVADRDRIARDLHDTVIQRLFATALQLQGLRRTAVLDEVKTRLDESVNELNTTIRDIRSTIFELRRPGGATLTADVRGLAGEYVPVLGFTPFVRLRGPIDEVVAPHAAEQLIATLRELLSNVARHAEADACMIEVEAFPDRLLMRVSDNGRGITSEAAESGLRNVRRRAFDVGGTVRVGPEEPHGTLIEWEVPL
ncbi:MAG: GAF domain-containing protein [Propionibacteriales bacterium]|nr:GAF domain-containing protein [Propionibacteriales bacterium]